MISLSVGYLFKYLYKDIQIMNSLSVSTIKYCFNIINILFKDASMARIYIISTCYLMVIIAQYV